MANCARATWRFSLVSVARYTSPIPPAPSLLTIRYEPNCSITVRLQLGYGETSL